MARNGHSKEQIKSYVAKTFNYDLDRTLASIRPSYTFNATCEGSVPESIIAFLESANFKDSIHKAISIGGDSDTIASMTASISHAFYKEIPTWMIIFCRRLLNPAQIQLIDAFGAKFLSNDK